MDLPTPEWTPAAASAITWPLGGRHRLLLSLPVRAAPPPPVLLVLDGAHLFGPVAEAVRLLARRPDATGVPPMLVAGIDRDPADAEARARDFTFGPPADPAERAAGEGGYGEGAAFLDRIAEAFSLVETGFGGDPGRRILLGHSLGGYFALEALVRRPDLCAATCALSPSLWWDREGLLGGLAALEDCGQALFIGVGGREQAGEAAPSERHGRRAMVANARRAATIAEGRLSSGRVRFAVAEEEGHGSTPIALLPAALRFLGD